MNVERLRKIIAYSDKNREDIYSMVKRFCAFAKIEYDSDLLNILQIVRSSFEKKGFFAKIARIFGGGYTTEDVYKTVDDYKDEDIYKTVMDYKTVMRDIFEEKVEEIEKFSISAIELHRILIAKMHQNLDDGIASALEYASEQVEAMKTQFFDIFKELDKIVSEKYDELTRYQDDEKAKNAVLAENQKRLKWIEDNIHEIDSILEL